MATPNRITNVAVVGATGHSGSFMTEALLKTGRHTITAITRGGSQNALPEGVICKKVDYKDPHTIVEALKGQDALVITLNGRAPHEIETQLTEAAGVAGVKWILPNEWSPDTSHEGLLKDVSVFQAKPATRKAIEDIGKSSYIALNTGFWYEWSLAIPSAFGFDFANRAVTFFDEGETKISISTWPQVGRAVAALLSLPIKAKGSNTACLEDFKNKPVYVNSFTVSQKDMFESALRVTGAKKADWTITNEPAQERYSTGIKGMQEGQFVGFVKMMYSRVFYPDGNGDFEHNKGTLNLVLELPKEDLDKATKVAIDRAMASS